MLWLALAFSLAAAPAAPAAPVASSRLTFAFIPPQGADDDTRALGLLLQVRTSEVLRATGLFNELHAKQMLSMAGAEAFKPESFGKDAQRDADVAWYLGADAFLSGTLERAGKGLTFGGTRGLRGGPAPWAIEPVKMGATSVAALNQAISDISKQMATFSKKKVAQWPDLTVGTASDDALLAYARCHATVLRQSMGIENPVVLNAEAVTGAIAECKRALELDPKFTAAMVALALAYAIEGNDAEATRLLAQSGEVDSALYWVTRFWLVTRYQSPDAGLAVLRTAVEKRPGFLLAQMYLCEEYTALAQYDEALKACEAAAAATPLAVFPLLRVGKVLARKGQYAQAIQKSQAALELEPKTLKSRAASLQLASRLIDAQKPNEAIAILEQIASDEQARGEELLRLGYAYQLKGDLEVARVLYEKALAKATSASEWRTRGRASYDLALLHAKAGSKEKARQALRDSLRTGYKVKTVDASLADVAKEIERADLGAAAPKKDKPVLAPKPKEVTLFQIDASGELEVGPAKAPPPDFIKLKF